MNGGAGDLLPATIIGFLGGGLVGMTGVGAGSVIAAGLLLAFPDIAPKLIVGSATAQAVVMKLFAVLARRRRRFREGALGFAMAAGAIPMAVLGAWVSSAVGANLLRPVIACVLLIVGFVLLAQGTPRESSREIEDGRAVAPDAPADPPRAKVGLIGALVGFIAGLTSIGTGTLFVSALAGPLRLEAHRAVAIALLAGLVTLVVSGATHALLGNVDLELAGGALLGSVPGALLGTLGSKRLSPMALRRTIGAGIALAAVLALARMGR